MFQHADSCASDSSFIESAPTHDCAAAPRKVLPPHALNSTCRPPIAGTRDYKGKTFRRRRRISECNSARIKLHIATIT